MSWMRGIRISVVALTLSAPALVRAVEEPAPPPAPPARPDQGPRRGPGGGGPGGGGAFGGGMDPAAIVERFKAALFDLDLTADQRPKAVEIMKEAGDKAAAMTADFEKNRTDFRERMAALTRWRDDVRTKLDALLDPAQKQKLAERVQATFAGRGGATTIERLRNAIKDLALTDEQKPKVEQLLADAQKQMEAAIAEMRQGGGGDRRAMGEKLATLVRDTRTKFEALLTPEQQAKLRQLTGAPEGPGGGPRGAGGGDVIDRLKVNLDKVELAAEQKSKVEDLLTDLTRQRDAVREEAQKAGANADRQAIAAKVQQITDDAKVRLQAILTPEQQTKLGTLMEQDNANNNDRGNAGRRGGGAGGAQRNQN